MPAHGSLDYGLTLPVKNHTDPEYKARFHFEVKQRLTQFATALGFNEADYDLRSLKRSDNSSGGIFLYHEEIHVSVYQECGFAGGEIQIYRGKSRKDFHRNPWAQLSIELLDNVPLLALIANERIAHIRALNALTANGRSIK